MTFRSGYLIKLPQTWPPVDDSFTRMLTDLGFGTRFTAELIVDGQLTQKDFVETGLCGNAEPAALCVGPGAPVQRAGRNGVRRHVRSSPAASNAIGRIGSDRFENRSRLEGFGRRDSAVRNHHARQWSGGIRCRAVRINRYGTIGNI